MTWKVLLADDSKTMRTIMRRSLEALGVSGVSEAGDGAEAVDLFRKEQFNLVLTDGNMPNKDGLAVIREIRAVDKRVPIIMITTEAEKRQVLRHRGRGYRLPGQTVRKGNAPGQADQARLQLNNAQVQP